MSDRFLRKNPNAIPLGSLKQPDFDVREYRTDEDIDSIAKSMDEEGQIMPLLLGEKEDGVYEILDGNHRFLAAKRLGWPDIDCIQTGAAIDDDRAQIIANITRLELNQAEKLATIEYMLNVLGLSQAETAREVGWDRAQVTKYAAVLTGYGEVKEFFMADKLGVTACYELNKLDDRDRATHIAKTAVNEGYADKDVIAQAQWARSNPDGEDKMRGAGGEQQTKNMKQVKKNAREMENLEGIDQEAIDEAQIGSGGSQGGGQGDSQAQDQEPQGPPCVGCGKPTQQGPVLQWQFHPRVAEKIGVAELGFGACCLGDAVDWWQRQQEQSGVEAEKEATSEESA